MTTPMRLDQTFARAFSRLLAVAFVVFAAGAADMSSAAACQWTVPGNLWLVQGNNFLVNLRLTQQGQSLRGRATHHNPRNRNVSQGGGSADGYIRGNNFHVTVYWDPKNIGIYTGWINHQGRLTGNTYPRDAKGNSRINATIYSEGFLRCL